VSFASQKLELPNSPVPKANGLNLCSKCDQPRIPEGGIVIKGKWMCAKCWVYYFKSGKR